MKHAKFVTVLLLMSIQYMGCSDEMRPVMPPPSTLVAPLPDVVTIGLNPIETNLKGNWYLRAMFTADTTFNDSVFNRSHYLSFTDTTYSSRLMPILKDNANLAIKGKPTDFILVNDDEFFSVPDSGRLRIIYSYFLAPNWDTSFLEITTLSSSTLVLTDTIQKKQWRFNR